MKQAVSPYLIALVAAWLLAHIIKYTIAWINGTKLDFTHQLFISGGMPSSHSATVVAVSTVILFKDGLNSGLFALAAVVSLIIMYDAVKVRRSSGEQGESLTALIKEQKSNVRLPRVAKGHTPIEVVAGAFVGLIIGFVVFLVTK